MILRRSCHHDHRYLLIFRSDCDTGGTMNLWAMDPNAASETGTNSSNTIQSRAVQLTFHTDFDVQAPTIASDGSGRVVYQQGADIWMWTPQWKEEKQQQEEMQENGIKNRLESIVDGGQSSYSDRGSVALQSSLLPYLCNDPGHTRRLSLTLLSDGEQLRPATVPNPASFLSAAHLSPTG
jgi:hypothetical protein